MLENGPLTVVQDGLPRYIDHKSAARSWWPSLPLRILPRELRQLSEAQTQISAKTEEAGCCSCDERLEIPGRAWSKKKMVPSDPLRSSFASRHARPEPGVWKPAALTSLALRNGCCPLRLVAQEAASADVSDEAGLSRRPFARPERLSLLGPPLRGLSFRSAPSSAMLNLVFRLVRLQIPSLSAGFPDEGEIITYTPLPISSPALRLASPALLPFGTFRPSGSILGQVRRRRLASAKGPMPFTPR
jgi:hypothetical protein